MGLTDAKSGFQICVIMLSFCISGNKSVEFTHCATVSNTCTPQLCDVFILVSIKCTSIPLKPYFKGFCRSIYQLYQGR